jgi:adenosylhomocysteine nucleosidase
MIGIIGAIQEEIAVIKNEMTNLTTQTIGNTTFYLGHRQGPEIVLVQSGIGEVNATIVATLLVNHFQLSFLFFSGVAGAVSEKLAVGDMVISRDVVQHDFDLTAFGYQRGQLRKAKEVGIPASPALIALAEQLLPQREHLHLGRILSGDQFISEKEEKIRLGKEFDALCVDMESAAVAQVCKVFQVDFLIIRSISDSVSDESKMEYETFLHQAANTSKKMLQELLQHLPKIPL